ncbi:glycerol kinase GlpK [Hymenobacter taeanensis]|uniref:Glycerol kinase n=1 Tax=Hymenobacter taeanensis TaxID=2735321 RepID=A0A6M6BHB6_9BACT|nr:MULTISPECIES: glycerol kinase GlpK [Hymenobacter]QJX47587.1 glycerol kinase GlpK [Hymenobacter taeanensis]UOQ82929.1 glycerol kinase GlpK [Hymenobacter sp. 5414T-23]
MPQYILALDQGTTSSRAILFDKRGRIVAQAQKEFTQIFPRPGWVEHDPLEIWSTQAGVAAEATVKAGQNGKSIAAIGITNQRETVVVWNRKTGKPIYNAIVWQDRRTAEYCDQLRAEGREDLIRNKTGLLLDAYFSASKVKWILDNVRGARRKAAAGELAFGTVDSWLIWNFTQGELHVTDVTNASRTMLFNIHTLQWDEELLGLFDIPRSMLPEVRQSSEVYGETKTTVFASKIPIAGIAGDQQAALFGQLCTSPGMVKNTYGTGCFMLMNTGPEPKASSNNLLTTVAWQRNGQVEYALEGSIFMAGAVVQWLRDNLGIIKTSAEVEQLAKQVNSTGGVCFVPAFAGLGAPYWDPYARAAIFGMSRATTAAHIARAALESIAFQTMDVLEAMKVDSGLPIAELRVDGGAAANKLLMQFQADVLDTKVIRPRITETTALGAAYLAGLAVGYWQNLEELQALGQSDTLFSPNASQPGIRESIENWHHAVQALRVWSHAPQGSAAEPPRPN